MSFLHRFTKFAALATLLLFAVSAVFAQTGAIAGKVTGPDGKPINGIEKGAYVKIERTDIKGEYLTEVNKKGEYFHAGLPLGTYKVMLWVDGTKEKKKMTGGRQADMVNGVRTGLGEPKEVNFDLKVNADRQAALAKAAETGQLTKEMEREMSPEQKAAIEKQMKERSESMKKNKALNDSFNAGMSAMMAKQWDTAIEQFTKGTEIDPKQYAIWANLAESYAGASNSKTGADQAALQDKAVQSYMKALELKPDDAGAYNNLALLYARTLKFKEAEDSCVKAAALDPGNGGKCYFNIGAILTNKGQGEPAGQAFKKSIEADPKNPEAHYQYGLYLFSKATTTADGKVTPPAGTKEEFQKYLEISPSGPNADSAKGMIQAIDATVTTTFVNPDAAKKTTKKK